MAVHILVGVIFILYWWRKSTLSSRKEPPIHPRALPVVGHAHILIGGAKHLWELIQKSAYEILAMGGVTTYNIAGRKFYLVMDPDDCLTVSNACLNKDLTYSSAKSCYGDGLVTASVNTWKEHRKLLNPRFNVNYLNTFLGVFNKQSRILVEDFALNVGKGPFDHGSTIRQNEMKTICLTSLGVDFNKDKKALHEFITALDIIFDSFSEQIQKFWLHIKFFWLRSDLKKKRDKYRDVMHGIIDEIITKRQDDQKNNKLNTFNGDNFRPFLDIFFDLKKTVGDVMMPDKTIRDHVTTLIVAGHDTVATAVQFTMILIGSYPKVQERVYAELLEVFGDSSRDVEKDDLGRLMYLDAVIKESLRFYTIVPIVARYVTKDVNLKNYTLKAGSACVLMLHCIHRHPMWGNDAEEFKPERWLDSSTLPKNPNAFLTFSLGRRVCIGKTYSMISMKTTLAHILRAYHITADHTKLELKFDCLLKAVSGHYISIEKREEINMTKIQCQ